jgi:hypothetical protein
VVMCID